MNEEQVLTFQAGGCYLHIELHERPFSGSDSEWDRAAIRTTISAHFGPFKADLETLVWNQDMAHLLMVLKELDQNVGREAQLTTTFGGYEQLLEIAFGLDKLGGLAIWVTIIDDPMTKAKLTFVIEADQSYLAGWIEMVKRILDNLNL